MNTNQGWKMLWMAGLLLALLASAGCGSRIEITSPAGQAMAADGNEIMVCLKDGDFRDVCGLWSTEAKRELAKAIQLAGNVVDVDSLIEQYAPQIASWSFESAQVTTEPDGLHGSLDGQVTFADGRSGKLRLELEQEGDTWKLRGFTFDQ